MADKTVELKLTFDTSEFKASSRQAANAARGLTGSLADVGLAADTVTRGVRQVTAAVEALLDAGREAAQMERTERMFANISGGAAAAAENLDAMRRATRGAATDAALMGQGLQLIGLGLADNAADLEEVARSVTTLGGAFRGMTSDRSIQEFALMMSNKTLLRADSFGLAIGEVTASIERLKAAGMGADEAFDVAVMEAMTARYEQLGAGVEDSALSFEQLDARAGNFSDRIKGDLLPLAEGAVQSLNIGLGVLEDAWEGLKGIVVSLIASNTATLYTLGDLVMSFVLRLKQGQALLQGNADAARDFGDAAADAFRRATSGETARQAFQQTVLDFYGDDVPAAATEAADAVEETNAQITQAQADEAAVQKGIAEDVAAAREELQKRIADEAIRQERRAEDEAIAALRRQEDAARDVAERRAQIAQQFQGAMAAAQAQYQRSVERAQQQHGERRADIERDYRKRLQEIQREYEQSSTEAARNRDALALKRAGQRRDEAVGLAQEERAEQMAEASRQYEQQLRAAREARAEQEQAARESLARQREELEQSLEKEAREQEIANRRKIEDQNLAQRRMLEDRQRWLHQRMVQIKAAHAQELAEVRAYVDEYRTHLSRISNRPAPIKRGMGGGRRRQSGGYATFGQYTLGEAGREFVLSAGTTRQLEAAASAPLTQQRVAQMAAGGSGDGRQAVTINDQRQMTFAPGISSADRAWIREAIAAGTTEMMTSALSNIMD